MSTTPFFAWTTATEFATALGLIGACFGGVLKVAFTGSAKSRCETISCCCGLVACKRKPTTKEELEVLEQLEQLQQEHPADKNNPVKQPL